MAKILEYALANSTYTDTSGNGQNLTLTGSLTSVAGWDGVVNGAALFPNVGTTKLLVADNALFSNLSAFTICFRIKPISFSTIQVVLTKGGTAADIEYAVVLNTTGKLELRVGNTAGTGNSVIVSDLTTMTVGSWYAFILDCDGTTARLFRDVSATPTATAAGGTGATFNGTTGFRIGGSEANGAALNSALQNLQFFNHVLSSTERANYLTLGSNFAPPTQVNANITVDDVTVSGQAAVANILSGTVAVDDVAVAGQAQILTPNYVTASIEVDEVTVTGVAATSNLASGAVTVEDIAVSGIALQLSIYEDVTWVAFAGDAGLACTLDVYRKPDYAHPVIAQAMSDLAIPLLYKTTIDTTGWNGEYLFWVTCTAAKSGKPVAFTQRYLDGIVQVGGLTISDIQTLNTLKNAVLLIPQNPLLATDARINGIAQAVSQTDTIEASLLAIYTEIQRVTGNVGGLTFEKWRAVLLAESAGTAHQVAGVQTFVGPDGVPQFTAQSDGAGGRNNAIL